jgi:hypothetical protein
MGALLSLCAGGDGGTFSAGRFVPTTDDFDGGEGGRGGGGGGRPAAER